MTEIIIDDTISNQRLDKFIMRLLPLSSKGNIYKLLRKKIIRLNGKRAKGNERLEAGDMVSLFLSDESIESLQERPLIVTASPLSIVYEDEHLLVMNKAAGVLSQKAQRTDIDTQNDRLLYYMDGKIDASFFTPGIANRLDRNTSGLILAGKHVRASQALQEIFHHGQIERLYGSIIHGKLDKPLELSDGYARIGLETMATTGQDMKSLVKPLEHFIYKGANYSLVEVDLQTGKTHQIRVQLEKAGYPLVGDMKYRGNQLAGQFNPVFKPFLLHAGEITMKETEGVFGYLYNQPIIGAKPKRFEELLTMLRNE